MKRAFPYSGGFWVLKIVKPGFGELDLSNRGGLINGFLTLHIHIHVNTYMYMYTYI